ncbi:F-box protein [Phanerochaete sordida]|uniref:F-box protein n=1 Tax=Phanerochaete sordida TaxID=48140 RepID=A0A9P3LD76_9APHY|nr:F-box protein [Phanerochaete sordida]
MVRGVLTLAGGSASRPDDFNLNQADYIPVPSSFFAPHRACNSHKQIATYSVTVYRSMDDWPPPPPRPFSGLQTAADVDSINDKLSHFMRSLNTVRNALTAPLPDDILLHVFHALVDLHDVGQPLETDSQLYTHYSWIVVTHVCRAWRNLAVNTSTLWTRIVPDRPQPAQAFLERSGQEHLLDVWGQHRVPMEYLEKYARRLRAVGRLYVGEDQRRLIQSFCEPDGVLHLPNLQLLYICVSGDCPEVAHAFMPRLTRLFLDSTRSFGETLLRRTQSLTHLEIHTSNQQNMTPLPQLLALIECLPMLEELHLFNAIAQDTSPLPRVELAKLRKISLQHTRGRVNAVPCARLLASLVYPWTAQVELVGLQPAHTFSDCQEVVSLILPKMLQDQFPTCSDPPLPTNHLSISCTSFSVGAADIRFALARHGASPTAPQGSLLLALSLNRDFAGPTWGRASDDHERQADEMLLLLLTGTSSRLAPEITHLTFDAGSSDIMPAERVDVWTYLHSAGLPLVSLVLTSGPNGEKQVTALIAAMKSALERQEPFFPHLQTLSVPRYITASWESLLNATASGSRGSTCWGLILVLWQRREQGLGPMSLGIGTDMKEVDEIEVYEDWDVLAGRRTKRTRLRTGLPWK